MLFRKHGFIQWLGFNYLKTFLSCHLFSFSHSFCLFVAAHTMSCEKSIIKCCPVGRFAVTTLDDCKKVPCCVPVCNNPCNHIPSCCECGCKSNCKKVACCIKPCTKSCNCVPPCCDYGCKGDCKKVACNNPCSNPCNYIPPCLDYDCQQVACKNIKDDCKGMLPCGSQVTGRFPVIKLDSGDSKEAFCKPVCERSTLMSCHDQDVKNVSGDCKGRQSCGNKMIGRFPVIKLDWEDPCCEPTHALAIDNMMWLLYVGLWWLQSKMFQKVIVLLDYSLQHCWKCKWKIMMLKWKCVYALYL